MQTRAPVHFSNYLIVDDDSRMLEAIALAVSLTYPDAVPIYALDGPEALAILGDGKIPIDLVLLDYMMPKLTGIETLARIRAEWPVLPVVILTGHISNEIVTAAMDFGADDYVVKDHLKATLAHVIWGVLTRSSAAVRSKRRTDEASLTLLAILKKLHRSAE